MDGAGRAGPVEAPQAEADAALLVEEPPPEPVAVDAAPDALPAVLDDEPLEDEVLDVEVLLEDELLDELAAFEAADGLPVRPDPARESFR